tara:strand:- start:1008 stop:3032 length:2025 start_codon:yes stop_codon:yes gene_type:complete
MCGIYGILQRKDFSINNKFLINSLNDLAISSESRGKDSSGICFFNNKENCFNIVKGDIPSNKLIKREKVIKNLELLFSDANFSSNKIVFGHSRLVTNGSQLKQVNNQPVLKNKIICVHNGIITNHEELWKSSSLLNREYEIDTEIIPTLIRKKLKENFSLEYSVKKTFELLKGSASLALHVNDLSKFILYTNNSSLYIIYNDNIVYFASEKIMLDKIIKKYNVLNKIGCFKFLHLNSKNLFSLDLINFDIIVQEINQIKSDKLKYDFLNVNPSKVFIENSKINKSSTILDLNHIHFLPQANEEKKILIYPLEKIKDLKRCNRCILPSTFPFINFNADGVCNYCLNYKKKNYYKSIQELKKLVAPYRKKDGSPDCLIPFSGGRDSVFTLHVIKEILELNPITFTYDWGMVTDLARRNIARICGKLDVENIIVAADIHWKRDNINKNIRAWLKNPQLGMIPLFMAGDKFFFHYAEKVKRENNIKLNIWGINHLENTDFKTGFAGIKPNFNKKRIYSLSIINQLKLFSYVTKNVVKTPDYLNQSILDSLGSFASRYISPKRDYYHLFDYMKWDEDEINDTLNLYDFEKSVDTNSTWRIGDGTASFYNYIYTLVAGFSENDTFRSNQIREGMISREKALKLVFDENAPRYNSLKWYLEMVGLDYFKTILTINKIKRLY